MARGDERRPATARSNSRPRPTIGSGVLFLATSGGSCGLKNYREADISHRSFSSASVTRKVFKHFMYFMDTLLIFVHFLTLNVFRHSCLCKIIKQLWEKGIELQKPTIQNNSFQVITSELRFLNNSISKKLFQCVPQETAASRAEKNPEVPGESHNSISKTKREKSTCHGPQRKFS